MDRRLRQGEEERLNEMRYAMTNEAPPCTRNFFQPDAGEVLVFGSGNEGCRIQSERHMYGRAEGARGVET